HTAVPLELEIAMGRSADLLAMGKPRLLQANGQQHRPRLGRVEPLGQPIQPGGNHPARILERHRPALCCTIKYRKSATRTPRNPPNPANASDSESPYPSPLATEPHSSPKNIAMPT